MTLNDAAEAAFAEGLQAVESGQLPVALEKFTSACALNPDEAKYRGYRAWTQYYARQPDEDAHNRASINEECFRQLEQAVSACPQYDPIHVLLGTVLVSENRCHDAIAAFNQALKINPSNNAAKLGLKAARRKLERSNDTASTIEERISDRPASSPDSTPSENLSSNATSSRTGNVFSNARLRAQINELRIARQKELSQYQAKEKVQAEKIAKIQDQHSEYVMELQKEIQKLSADKSEAEAKYLDVRNTLDEEKKKLGELLSEQSKATGELSLAHKEIESQIEKADKKSAALNRERDSLVDQLSKSEAKLEDLEQTLQAERQVSEVSQQSIAELTQEFEQAKLFYEREIETIQNEQKSERRKHEEERAKLSKQIDQLQGKHNDSIHQKSAQNKELEQLKVSTEKAEREIAEKNERLVASEKQLQEALSASTSKEVESRELERLLDQYKLDLGQLQEQLETRGEQLESNKEYLDQITEEVRTAREQIEELTTELEEKKNENEKLKFERIQAEERLTLLPLAEQALEEKEKEITSLTENLAQTSDQLEELKVNSIGLEQEKISLLNQVEQLIKESAAKPDPDEVQELHEQYESLQHNLSKLQETSEDAAHRASELEREKFAAKSYASQLMSALEEQQETNEALELELKRGFTEREKLQLTNQELKEELHNRPTKDQVETLSQKLSDTDQKLVASEKRYKDLQTEMLKREEKGLTEMIALKEAHASASQISSAQISRLSDEKEQYIKVVTNLEELCGALEKRADKESESAEQERKLREEQEKKYSETAEVLNQLIETVQEQLDAETTKNETLQRENEAIVVALQSEQRRLEVELVASNEQRFEYETLLSQTELTLESTQNELEQQIQTLTENSSLAKAEYEANEKQFLDEISALSEERDELTTRLAQQDDEATKLQGELVSRLEELESELNNQYTEREADAANFSDTEKQYRELVEEQNSKLTDLEQQFSSTTELLEEKMNTLSQLEQDFEEKTAEFNEKSSTQEENISQLGTELKETSEQLANRNEELSELSVSFESLQQSHDEISEKLNSTEEQLEKLTENSVEQQETINNLTQSLNEATQTLEDVIEERNQQKDEFSNSEEQYQSEKQELHDILKETQQRLEEKNESLTETHGALETLQMSFIDLQREQEETQSQFEELQTNSSQQTESVEKLTRLLEESADEINALTKERDQQKEELTEQIRLAYAQVEALEQTAKSQKDEFDKLHAEQKERFSREKEESEEQARQKLKEFQRQLEELKQNSDGRIVAIEMQAQNLTDENDQLRKSLDVQQKELTAALEDATKENLEAKKINATLKGDLEEKSLQHNLVLEQLESEVISKSSALDKLSQNLDLAKDELQTTLKQNEILQESSESVIGKLNLELEISREAAKEKIDTAEKRMEEYRSEALETKEKLEETEAALAEMKELAERSTKEYEEHSQRLAREHSNEVLKNQQLREHLEEVLALAETSTAEKNKALEALESEKNKKHTSDLERGATRSGYYSSHILDTLDLAQLDDEEKSTLLMARLEEAYRQLDELRNLEEFNRRQLVIKEKQLSTFSGNGSLITAEEISTSDITNSTDIRRGNYSGSASIVSGRNSFESEVEKLEKDFKSRLDDLKSEYESGKNQSLSPERFSDRPEKSEITNSPALPVPSLIEQAEPKRTRLKLKNREAVQDSRNTIPSPTHEFLSSWNLEASGINEDREQTPIAFAELASGAPIRTRDGRNFSSVEEMLSALDLPFPELTESGDIEALPNLDDVDNDGNGESDELQGTRRLKTLFGRWNNKDSDTSSGHSRKARPKSSRSNRHYIRLQMSFDDGEDFHVARVVDISESGVYLQTAEVQPIDTNLTLSPVGVKNFEDLELKAVVVRSNQYETHGFGKEPAGMGLRFLPMKDKVRKQLIFLIRQLKTVDEGSGTGTIDPFLGVRVENDSDLQTSQESHGPIHIIGSQTRALSIAHHFARMGQEVMLYGVEERAADAALERFRDQLREQVTRGVISEETSAKILSSVEIGSKQDLKAANIVFEVCSDFLSVKKSTIKQLEKLLDPSATIISSVSEGGLTSELAEGMTHPKRLSGIVFSRAPDQSDLVEIVRSRFTSTKAVLETEQSMDRAGIKYVVMNDNPGLFLHRLLGVYFNEAGHLIDEGASFEAIEGITKGFGFAKGPLQMMDELGFDFVQKNGSKLQAAFGERMKVPGSLREITQSPRQGARNGIGFFRHSENGQLELDQSAYIDCGQESDDKDQLVSQEELRSRLLLVVLNESARLLGDNIVSSPSDIDSAVLAGMHFPHFRQGLLHYADSIRPKEIIRRLESLEDKHGPRFSPCAFLRALAEQDTLFYPQN
ncbi:MAG: 3-hydroxyacyl-CoA dehydrogenase NAD-binding domain-containing protein [Myxococcota bacterium]|nr:3-hydroxyacyl-CoA dehydrogenase NAD-binding domain-containing protein [Myxococcota bacterium]